MCTLALFRSDGAHADGARAARLPQHREALAAGGGAPAPRLSDVHARKGGAPVRLRAQALPRGARLPAQSGRRGLRPRGQGPPPHSDYSGVLGAEIEPKNRVLPLLRRHFCNRYANESFFIYDRTHREMLLYTKGRSRLACVDSLQLELPGEEEVYYRTLWKRFFETVAIRERENPRCQNTFMPKRYRGTMTEFLPADNRGGDGPPPSSMPPVMPPDAPCGGAPALATPSGSPAGAPAPGAPAGRPVPATRQGSAPSAPASSP